MVMILDDQDDSQPPGDGEPLAELMSRRERQCAVGFGLLAGGAGGYAVFASSNQGGTVMLLLLSVIFLLIGVQGTPLVRFTSSSASVELSRRQRVNRALRMAKEEENPERAAGIVEGVAIAEPGLVPKSYASGLQYEHRVISAFLELNYIIERSRSDFSYDFVVVKGARRAAVILKYYSHPIPPTVIRDAIGTATHSALPTLLVANQPMTSSAAEAALTITNFAYALWRDQRDNDNLKEALIKLGIENP
jgi:hypothetical protein